MCRDKTIFAWQVISHCVDARPCNDFVVLRRVRNCLCIIIILLEKFHVRRGCIDNQFRGLFTKICVSSCCKKRGAQQLTEVHSMHALFSVCCLRDDNLITSKPTCKVKHANSILEPSEYFCQISSKSIHIISSYTVSNLGRFLRHSVVAN